MSIASSASQQKLADGAGEARSSSSSFFQFADGSSYEGEVANQGGKRVRHGQGVYRTASEEYTGSWENDKMSGQGVYKYRSGAVYNGQFIDGKMHGEGKYIFPDGAYYSGSWVENKMSGQGTYCDSAKTTWTGEFYNGMFNSGRSYVSIRPSGGF